MFQVEEEVYTIDQSQVKDYGPYSSVRRSLRLDPGHGERLLVITASSDAKVMAHFLKIVSYVSNYVF